MEQLKAGDVVILASGGPPMTVAEITPWGEVFCIWFTDGHRCASDVFDRTLLRTVPEPLEDAATAPFIPLPHHWPPPVMDASFPQAPPSGEVPAAAAASSRSKRPDPAT